MVRFYCMKGCGCNYSTSIQSPTMPRGVGMGLGCPKHGWTVPPDHAVNTPTHTHVCPKCGLLNNQSMTKQSPKFNGGIWAMKCIDCNKPTAVGDFDGVFYYCIRCGRCYDGRYNRKDGSGGVMIRCPKCGGNGRMVAAV